MSKIKVNNPYIFNINKNTIFSSNNKKNVTISPSGWSLDCYSDNSNFGTFYCPGPQGRTLTAYVETRSMGESFTFKSEEEGVALFVSLRFFSGDITVKIGNITKSFNCSSGDTDLTVTIRY